MRSSLLPLTLLLFAGCARDDGVVRRSLCPAVAVPQYAGEVTRFVPGRRDQGAVTLEASITNVRGTCIEGSPEIATRVTFDVVARRRGTGAAEAVQVPVFVVVTRAGEIVVNKAVVPVTLAFAAGSERAAASGAADTRIARDSVALPDRINRMITRERKAGELDAAQDPLAEPKVKDAVRQASFEVLVGFQLAPEELAYNATK